MVEILFYNNSQDKQIINKSLNDATSLSGLFIHPFNVINPVIVIRSNTPVTFNYCFIPSLNRYYFVESITIQTANTYQISLNIDVLQTYAQEILNSTGTILTRENANKFISSRETIYDIRPHFVKIELENPFDKTGQILLITIKGNK